MPACRASIAALAAFVVIGAVTLLGQSGARSGFHTRGYEALLLAIDRLLVASEYPLQPNNPNVAADRQMLTAALVSEDPMARAVAIRGVGQFQAPVNVPNLITYLKDKNPDVRREAANAIAQSLIKEKGAAVIPALRALQAVGTATVLESIARLHFDPGTADEVERWLLPRSDANAVMDAILLMAEQLADHRLLPETAQLLRQSVTQELHGPGNAAHASRYLPTLASSLTDSEEDTRLLLEAARYVCPNPPRTMSPEVCGTGVRLAAAGLLRASNPAFAEALDRLRHDVGFHVRIVALRKFGQDVPRSGNCAPLIEAITDDREVYTIVKIEALALLQPNCQDLDTIVARLESMAVEVDAERRVTQWHLPAAALEAVARLAPEKVAGFLERAPADEVWQVRAAAARIAAVVKNDAALLKLVHDDVPNVLTETLTALAKIHSPVVFEHAQRLLESKDYQLVMTAAHVLKSTPNPAAPINDLLHALTRITAERSDTSREVRVAILETLAAYGPKNQKVSPLPLSTIDGDFVPYLKDFDPKVADAAADVLEARKGVRPTPMPTMRLIEQPAVQELYDLQDVRLVKVDMSNGDTFDLRLLWDEAPLAVARFVKLVNKRYFDGLTFHRVVPLFVVQGGSPGANEYAGQPRYQRDEIGLARHQGSAVGISTRGRDTGDGQIFIDLTTQTRLDFLYTVFAYVSGAIDPQPPLPAPQHGMAAVSAMLEGATIARMVVK